MYTKEEYDNRIAELENVAMELIMNQRPEDARKAASEMTPEDAYILGMHIGTILQIAKLEQTDELTNEKNT
jgi:hypothetical protein